MLLARITTAATAAKRLRWTNMRGHSPSLCPGQSGMDPTLRDSRVLSRGLVIPAPEHAGDALSTISYLTKGHGRHPVFTLLHLTGMAYLPSLGIF